MKDKTKINSGEYHRLVVEMFINHQHQHIDNAKAREELLAFNDNVTPVDNKDYPTHEEQINDIKPVVQR